MKQYYLQSKKFQFVDSTLLDPAG